MGSHDHPSALREAPSASAPAKSLLVILKTGAEDKGLAAVLAFAMGVSSKASLGIDTTIFLVGSGAHWAVEGASRGVASDGFPPLADLMLQFQEAGGRVVVCSTCTESFCMIGEGADKRPAPMIPGIDRVGFTYIARMMVTSASTTF
jgi:predicted peroxiredoxin